MKKITLIFTLICAYSLGLNAQTIVSTNPENKKVILEEFTGTGCPNCPAGHQEAASILAANPGNVFVVAYHPNNSSYTTSDPMATTYPAAFYSNPFCGSSRFMPSAFINRRDWGGGELIQSRADWAGHVNTIKAESSPLNVGVSSSYETSSSTLTVLVEVYFTANVTDPLTIYCELTEDGIVATQSGGTSPYTHNHCFREAFVAQWGDNISTPTTLGTLKTFNFTFDNSNTNYDMAECEVLAFVRNANDEEIVSGNGAMVGETSILATDDLIANELNVSIFPNPINENSHINFYLNQREEVSYSVYNLMGQEIYHKELGTLGQGPHNIPLNSVIENQGIYLLNISVGENRYTERILVQ